MVGAVAGAGMLVSGLLGAAQAMGAVAGAGMLMGAKTFPSRPVVRGTILGAVLGPSARVKTSNINVPRSVLGAWALCIPLKTGGAVVGAAWEAGAVVGAVVGAVAVPAGSAAGSRAG